METTQKHLILVTGGARSGKSSYAEKLARDLAGTQSVLYVATATASDDEMADRIRKHRSERPIQWMTLEEPTDPAGALMRLEDRQAVPAVVLIDCLTMLTANLLVSPEEHATFDESTFNSHAAEQRVSDEIGSLLEWYDRSHASLIMVSNEVGMGIVPSYLLGRVYRDLLGRVNARIAQRADAVLLLIAGLPIEVKSLAAEWMRQSVRLTNGDIVP